MRAILTGLVLLTMVAGCASPQPTTTPPVSAAPSSPSPAPAPTTPPPAPTTPPQADHVPVGKLSPADVAYVTVTRSAPDNRSALLWPATHAAAITALVDAFNSVAYGRTGGINSELSAAVTIGLKRPGSHSVALHLYGQSGAMVLGWDEQRLVIDSPTLAQAVAALDPLLQPPPKPGSQFWAVDPAGNKAPEMLLKYEQPLGPAASSPDGRYWLLTRNVGLEKYDFSAVPYLLDRTTGALREGTRTDIRAYPTWSGNGFFINWPAHLDLALKEDHMPALRKALGLESEKRELIHIAFTGDGKRFAALIGPRGLEEPVDLLIGNVDGTGITTVPAAIRGTATQSGIVANVVFSPDGEWLAIAGQGPVVITRAADAAARERWTQLLDSSGWVPMTWSPNSRYVELAGHIYDRTGKLILDISPLNRVTWRPDSKAVIVQDYAQVLVLGLDGSRTDLTVPDWSQPAGFLPDGRLLVFRTIYPDQR